ncbi:MAG: hypothetical protein GY729_00845 [Desulfobacteraceae bacterium]|nr:hypothetical protein [Desulfobacteraceae bacterium]
MKQNKKRFLIICGYFTGESYGLLGPQMAATIINENSPYSSIVAGITNEDNLSDLKSAVYAYFREQKPVIGFASLGGRPDLFDFAGELKEEGATTILAGPQAAPDFIGEKGCQKYHHRFQGLSDNFSFALHGPAQQILPWLCSDTDLSQIKGAVYKNGKGKILQNPSEKWEDRFLSTTDWQTLYTLDGAAFVPLKITTAQVLSQIGCPHASKERKIFIDYPSALQKKYSDAKKIAIVQKGCSFCDVATDKGFVGVLGKKAVQSQLQGLPQGEDNKKIPFELINESPLFKLGNLLDMAQAISINLSQINLTLRADYFLKGISPLTQVLKRAGEKDIRILFSSIGFEAFDDTILNNLNKGVDVKSNVSAIQKIRALKADFLNHFGYMKQEGAVHGFIHPTPWDTQETSYNTNRTISLHQLARDILPPHSTPLIIHHFCGLGDWIREVEIREKVEFARVGSTIGWWQMGDEFLL